MLRIPEKNVRFLLDFGKSAAYNSKLENNCSRLASESVKKMLNPSNFLLVLNSAQQTCFKIKKNQNRIEYELRFLLFLKIVLNTRAVFSKVHKSYSVRNAVPKIKIVLEKDFAAQSMDFFTRRSSRRETSPPEPRRLERPRS